MIDTDGPRYLIAKTDPITFTANQIGSYAVHVNANDIATMGAHFVVSRHFVTTGRSDHSDVAEQIFHDTRKACKSIGVSLVGRTH